MSAERVSMSFHPTHPHEELHPEDAERLEELREMWELSSTEAVALQADLRELSDKAAEVRSRLRKQLIVEIRAKREYDTFKSALAGMKDGRYL